MGEFQYYRPPTTPAEKAAAWENSPIAQFLKKQKEPKIFDPFDPSTPIPQSYYDESLKEADKARSDLGSQLSFIPDLTKSGAAGLPDLNAMAEEERKNLLTQAATESKAPMLNLMQPSQEFQQQMKGREVALRRASGDGLGALNAMQDKNYVLGSGSALRQKPEPIAPEWTKINRAARRLRRQGYTQEAGQMASLAEMERLGTPTIDTQEQRNRMKFMGMEQDAKSEEQRRVGDIFDMYMRKRFQQEINNMV
jgi:hypothetical protein